MSTTTKTGGRAATTAVIPGRYALSVGDPNFQAPEGFAWVPLSSVARLESGHTPSRNHPEYWDGGVPWVGIRDAVDNHGSVIDDTLQHVSGLGIENSSARMLPEGTVCLSRTASVGYVVIMGASMSTSQDFVNWVCGPELNNLYLAYILQGEQEFVRSVAFGTIHKTLYYPDAKALHVMIPHREVQERVVAVLAAIDGKVKVNRNILAKTMELGDLQFRNLLKDCGMACTYGEIAEVSGGGTPSTKQSEYWDGDIRWATPTDVTALDGPFLDETSRRITDSGLSHCASSLYPRGSILMTSRATIGEFAIAAQPTATNQGFIVANAFDCNHQLWLFHEMRFRVSDYIAHANGATFLELSRGKFKELPVAWPLEESTFAAFNARVKPLHDRAYAAMKESRTLATLRDTLLPALMSGRLSVRDAEAAVSEVV